MKKRRELDALVNGNSKLGRSRKKQTKGQHELLRNDTDSSDLEEFSIPEKTVVRKRGPSRFCATCLTVCGFFLLVSCMVAIGGLVWVHLELKNEIITLQNKMASAQGSSEGSINEIFEIKKQLGAQKKSLEDLTNGENGLAKVQTSIADLKKQVASLNVTTKTLQKGLAEAPQLASLPTTVSELSTNVASMGSDLQGLKNRVDDLESFKTQSQSNVESLTEQLKAIDERGPSESAEITKKPTEAPSPAPTPVDNSAETHALEEWVTQSINRFNKDLENFNTSVFQIKSTVDRHHVVLEEMKQNSSLVDQRVSALEVKSLGGGTDAGVSGINMGAIVSNVLEELKNATIDERTEIDHVLLQEQEYKVSNVSARITQLSAKVDQIQGGSPSDDAVRVEEEFMKYTTQNNDRMQAMSTTLGQLTTKVQDIENVLNIGTPPSDSNNPIENSPTTSPAQQHSTTTSESPDYGSDADDDNGDGMRKKRLVSDEEVNDLLNSL